MHNCTWLYGMRFWSKFLYVEVVLVHCTFGLHLGMRNRQSDPVLLTMYPFLDVCSAHLCLPFDFTRCSLLLWYLLKLCVCFRLVTSRVCCLRWYMPSNSVLIVYLPRWVQWSKRGIWNTSWDWYICFGEFWELQFWNGLDRIVQHKWL